MSKSNQGTKKWLSFAVMLLAAGTVYKLYFMDGVFYVQMRDFMGLSNTQIGLLTTIAGWISTFSFLAATYITDRFSKKKLIPFALIADGLLGIIVSTFPPYHIMLPCFCLFAVCADMLFWPTMLKTIRLLGNDSEQGRMFGLLETGRGLVDTVVNFSALAVFVWLGSNALGLRGAILFYSGIIMAIGIMSFFLLEDDKIAEIKDTSEKNRIVFSGMKTVFKNKGIWLVGFNAFMVYAAYTGIKYFSPFLNDVYAMPVALVSAYSIINSYGLKMLGGPVGGFISDKVTKSSAKFIRITFVVAVFALIVFIMMPPQTTSVYVAVVFALGISSLMFCMRAVYFAPMSEVGVPTENTGSAMALGSFIGYLPGAFMNLIYAPILDSNPGYSGYKIVFIIMMGISVVGVLVSSMLVRTIKRTKTCENTASES